MQQLVETRDAGTGAVNRSWADLVVSGVTYSSVPAEVLTGPGREFVQSGATQAEGMIRVNMRWFPGLTAKMRIVWDSNPYNITSIETDATARREYRLKCSTGVSDGQ